LESLAPLRLAAAFREKLRYRLDSDHLCAALAPLKAVPTYDAMIQRMIV
jgi:hypothetical protein